MHLTDKQRALVFDLLSVEEERAIACSKTQLIHEIRELKGVLTERETRKTILKEEVKEDAVDSSGRDDTLEGPKPKAG